jgi:hypothetical protein
MLTRFKDPLIQTEMIFCFAQHMRLQSIIEFETTEPLFIEKEAAWRRKAMVDFYKAFFPEEKQKNCSSDLLKEEMTLQATLKNN